MWIETFRSRAAVIFSGVTPHAGVWIETEAEVAMVLDVGSLPMRECGLKRISFYYKLAKE